MAKIGKLPGLGAIGTGIGAGASWIGRGLADLGKKLFGSAASAALNNNQQQDGGSDEQQLNIEEAEPAPNVAPIQQLNMAASGLISPMAPGGTPDEKLDYIVASINSMRQSLSTLVSSVRSLAIGQATVNRNVAATAERPKSGFIRNTITGAAKAAGIGTVFALGIGGAAGGLAALMSSEETAASTLDNIVPAVEDIKSGRVKPEESNLYSTVDTLITRYDQSHGMPVSFETSIEQAMEEDERIKKLVDGLISSGVEVDTKAMLSTLPDTIKNINPQTQQQGANSSSITPNQPDVPQVDNQAAPSPNLNTPTAPGTDETILENSTASPRNISPPAAPPPNNGANIEPPPDGETREDELGISPQSSLRDTLQENDQEQILSSTRNIRDRSMETANAKSTISPIVVSAPQAPSQQPMITDLGGGRDRGATLIVAYRTPADTRTYAQDNFASV